MTVLALSAFWIISLVLPTAVLGQTKFIVSALPPTLDAAPLWVADKKGFFQREGLDAEVVVAKSTAYSLQALAGGLIHAALADNHDILAHIDKGSDLAIVAAGCKSSHMIVGGKNIKSYEDLRGKSGASSTLSTGTASLLRRLLRAHGLEQGKDYSWVELARGGSLLDAVASGKVAGAVVDVPDNFRAQEMGFQVLGKLSDLLPNYLRSSFAVRRKWAAQHRADLVRFVKALLQARKLIEDHPDLGAEFLAQQLKVKLGLARRGLDYHIETRSWGANFTIEPEIMKSVIKTHADHNEMKGPLPGAKKYFDLSYLNAALHELAWR